MNKERQEFTIKSAEDLKLYNKYFNYLVQQGIPYSWIDYVIIRNYVELEQIL